jgi:hypothetical protein
MKTQDLIDATWRKSPYSGSNEGECVELAVVWRNAYSGSERR